MSEVAVSYVSLLPSAKGFGRKLDSQIGGEVQSSGKRLGMGFGKMFAAGGALLAAAGVGSFLTGAIGEAREAQKVGALTTSIIKSTGGAAKISAGQIGELASAISLKTGMDDEAIQSGANMLLTFKNVKREGSGLNDIFGRATSAAADLSAAGFGGLNGQAKMLGKALNDPIKGISALSRSGVTFTEGQKEQIKTLVASGDTLKAQKIIMGEVESQVGGAAAASATFGEKAGVAFGNIKEDVGAALLPALDGMFKLFLSATPTISKAIAGIGPLFTNIGTALSPLAAQVKGFFAGEGGSAITSFVDTIRANAVPIFQQVVTLFTGTILPAFQSFVGYLVANLLPVFVSVFGIIRDQVIPIIMQIAGFLVGTLFPAIFAIYTSIASSLKPVFDQLVATFQAKVLPAIQSLLAKFREWMPTIQKVIMVVVKMGGALAKIAAAILAKVLPVVIKFAGWLISTLVSVISTVVGWVIKFIGWIVGLGSAFSSGIKAVGRFAKSVGDKIGDVVGFVKGLPNKAKSALGNVGDTLLDSGKALLDGFKRGITDGFEKVKGAVKDGMKKVRDFFPFSPAKKGPFAGKGYTTHSGKALMTGLAQGIAAASPLASQQMRKAMAATGNAAVDGLKKALGTAKSALARTTADIDLFGSIRDQIAGVFAPDMFSGTVAQVMKGLASQKVVNARALADFKKLSAAGFDPKFLTSLMASGNTALISAFAANTQMGKTAQADWLGIQSSANALGMNVAQNEVGEGLAALRKNSNALNKMVDKLPDEIAKRINGAAKKGKRGRAS